MKFRKIAHLPLLVLISLLIHLIALTVGAEDQERPWDPAEISQAHLDLGEQKRQAVERWWQYQQETLEERSECTQTNYDVLVYDIDMNPDDLLDSLFSAVRILARATEDNVTEIQIDYRSSNIVDSITMPSGPVVYGRDGDVITITLDQTYNVDDTIDVELFTRSYKYWREVDGELILATASEPWSSRDWWPCKDRPDDKADSFHIAITVDTSYYVGSNGTLDSVVAGSDRWQTWYYTEHYPMVTYLFSLAIADYTVWYDEWVYNNGADTMPIVNAPWPEQYLLSLTSWEIVPDAITFFSELWGPYPFADEKYGHTNWIGGGAMEHQTMSTMGNSDWVFEFRVVIHELAHQWWGDMITCRSWGHLWLNEGWASYAEAIYVEEQWGTEAYIDYMTGMEYYGSNSVYSYDTTSNLFSLAQYDKGAWVLHQLRRVIGDSAFDEGVRDYYNSPFQHGTATTEDFRGIMESASGQNLEWFFDQWVYGWKYPIFEWAYWDEPSDSGGYDVYIAVDQVQTSDPQLFITPLDFQIKETATEYVIETGWVDRRHQILKFNVPLDDIMIVMFDPDNWVLDTHSGMVWGIRIVTFDEELHNGQQFLPYIDTVEAKGGYGLANFTVTGGTLPEGYTLDEDGIISGTTSDTGWFTFTVYVEESGPEDEVELNLYVGPTVYICGDVDYNWEGPNIADLTYLVAFLFTGGPPPPVMETANIDGIIESGSPVNIADLTYLVAYLFTGGPVSVC
ncbi:MAG: hypothetical protein KOO62_10830 [candidate division Zixibacteria bacterium]|nr:hypothetical protein [candidate division Zixibacteria bacterium]